LSYYNNQIEIKSKALTSCLISCIRERREVENLHNEKARIEALDLFDDAEAKEIKKEKGKKGKNSHS
jgi:hypothetical protein